MQAFCSSCRTSAPDDPLVWRCSCGGPFDLPLTPFPQIDLSDRAPTLWRYRETFPLAAGTSPVTFDEGMTPLTRVDHASGHRPFLKQDHLFPTGSFKDRGASLLLTCVVELGIDSVLEDSSGNVGAAVAAYAARAGIGCDIYLPDTASPAKQAQIRAFGAGVHAVPGPREAAADAARAAAGSAFFASHVWNPWFLQGTKTIAFEIWEQLGSRAPGAVVTPAGNGTLLLGLHIGFSELHAAGRIDAMPQLVAVQTSAVDGLYRMWSKTLEAPPELPATPTIAEGIAVRRPARAKQIVDAVRSTHGRFLTVSEDAIQAAHVDACRRGWYIEPTSAVALAALEQLEPDMDEPIVVPLTGHGLKHISGG